MRSRRIMLAAVALAATATATPAQAQEPPPWLKLQDGVTQPQFALADAIEETVFVETQLDTDNDGARDRVRIRISRPRETDTRGIDVPVVFEHSPYRGPAGAATNHDVDIELTSAKSLDGSLDDYYVPRGYAVVLGESIGTFNSTGCPDVGGPAETARREGGDRLAQRPRPRVRPGRRSRDGRLDDRRRRHDRRLVQRHARQPGRDDRRRRAQGDRPRLGDLQLVRLLPRQRARRRPPLEHPRHRRERLPGRGHRRARATSSAARGWPAAAPTSARRLCSSARTA